MFCATRDPLPCSGQQASIQQGQKLFSLGTKSEGFAEVGKEGGAALSLSPGLA